MRYTFISDDYAAVKNNVCYEDQNEDYCGAAIDKLAAYEDAEEQGRLVILPCKVGDTVYKLWYEPCHFGNTLPDSFDCDGCVDACDIKQAVVEDKAPSVEWIIRNITGKRPFAYVNREEAEAALKGETKDV